MKNFCCDTCHRAKTIRHSFPNSSIKTQKPFELIHYYVQGQGPYKNPTLSGAHYFLSIIDDFSITTWIYLMKNKAEVDHLLVSFIATVHKQFDSHVKQIRSDNGTEFTAHKFQ